MWWKPLRRNLHTPWRREDKQVDIVDIVDIVDKNEITPTQSIT